MKYLLLVTVILSATASADTTTPTNETPRPDRMTAYGAGATLSLLTTRTTSTPVDPAAPGADMNGTGLGLTLRYQTGYPLGSGNFRFAPLAAFETGLGYNTLDGEYTGPLWFLLRLEFGLDAGFRVQDDIEIGARATFIGHLNAAREVGSSDDVWTLKGFARYQRATVAVGVKSPFQEVPLMEGGDDSHIMAGVQYQFDAHRYAGVEYMRFAGTDDGSDYASHEVRLVFGFW